MLGGLKISQKDFNKHMNSYINNLSSQSHFSGNKVKVKKKECVPDDLNESSIHIERKVSVVDKVLHRQPKISEEDFEMGKQAKVAQQMSKEDQDFGEEVEEFEVEQEEKKEGFFDRLKSVFSKKKSMDESDDVSVDKIEQTTLNIKSNSKDEDIKALSKIMYRVLGLLDDQQLSDFKTSKDYTDYKAILERNKLLKK